jgi:hypothetical protein
MSATGNGSLRLLAAQVVIQDWRLHDDTRQPHSSLKYKTPVDFAAQFANQILLFLLDTKSKAGHCLLLEHGVKPKRLSNVIRFRCSPGTSSASGIGGVMSITYLAEVLQHRPKLMISASSADSGWITRH